jgi:mono/diheme cytochrome c family protein
MTEKSSEFLSGAELDNWWVTSLRGDWKTGIGALSVEQIAELLTFMRSRWGNDAKPVSAGVVKKLREQDI